MNTNTMNAATPASLEGLKLYSLAELEPILGVTHRTLLSYVTSGKLKAVKIGGMWKVSNENLHNFINGSGAE